MTKIGNIQEFADTSGEPSVDETLFRGSSKTFAGGTRGKNEHRKHVNVDAVFGRWGKKTYFRGLCWNCDTEHIGYRTQNRKNLLKCKDCGETSFVYKGFFRDRNRYPIADYEIPRTDEVSETMYICVVKYSDINPTISILTESTYQDRVADEKYEVQLIETRD